MIHAPKIVRIPILTASLAVLCSIPAVAQSAQIRHVSVVNTGGATEIRIETSQRVLPMTQIVSDPDRLVIDFPDALPGPQLHTVAVNKGEIKTVRASLLTSKPAMTRIVIDLKSAQDFRLIPTSNSVTVKLLGGAPENVAASAPPPPPAAPAHAEHARTVVTAPTPEAPVPSKPPSVSIRPTITVEHADASPNRPRATAAPVAAATNSAPATAPVDIPSAPRTNPSQLAQIRRVALLKSGGAMEIEIETDQRVVPTTQLIAGPDRLVIDFPGALPGPQLRALAVNQGEVKGVRAGLLTSKPPVTRVVLDLKSPQEFRLFPSSKSVVVKLPGSVAASSAPPPPPVAAEPEVEPAPPPEPPKKVLVSFQDGMLSITSTKGSLAEVLAEIQSQTGAEIAVPAGAEQEEVAVSIGPASPKDALSQLLNGSRYNFIIVGSDSDPNKVDRVVLSPKGNLDIAAQNPSPAPEPVPVADVTAPRRSVRSVRAAAAPPAPVPATDDAQPQGDSNPPPDTTPQPGDPQPAPN
jgi:AMIN domain